ncbi:hypothetical protein FRB96_000397 [Tulasnella sp. 330]|nr:hypothetical protein FRB96_000397 [Tulasnella sp. 330]KAG8885342.1 hypothetical protein FRB97_001417 [Tulasnella sp. 331]
MLPGIQLAPAPSQGRGATALALLPIYYSSESFVEPLRADVSALLNTFASNFSKGASLPFPFTLFKTIWKENGWNFMHLKCTESKSRVAFLETVFRVFIEKINDGSTGSVQAAAMFGLYIFFSTQPPPASGQYGLNKIPMAIDTLQFIQKLPDTVPSCLRPHVLFVIHQLTSTHAFAVLPQSSIHPYTTRDLPNAVVTAYEYAAKGGRPSKSHKIARARVAVNRLGAWVDLLENPSAPAAVGGGVVMNNNDEKEGPQDPPATASSSRTLGAVVRRKATTGPPENHLKKHLSKRQQQTQRLVLASTTIPNLIPPDLADYVALKASLKHVLPVDILRQAENETKETMNGVEEYAARRGIVPDNGWGGLKRMQQQKSMLDFVKDVNAQTARGSGSPS